MKVQPIGKEDRGAQRRDADSITLCSDLGHPATGIWVFAVRGLEPVLSDSRSGALSCNCAWNPALRFIGRRSRGISLMAQVQSQCASLGGAFVRDRPTTVRSGAFATVAGGLERALSAVQNSASG